MIYSREIPLLDASCVALGFFDGIHRGHAAVISAAFAGETQPEQANPAKLVLSVGDPGRLGGAALLTDGERERALTVLETQMYIQPDFSLIKPMSGENFVREILIERLHAVRVACGFNYTFGAGASCNASRLVELCGKYGVRCCIVPPVSKDGMTVSASAVREHMLRGEIGSVTAMLGRRWGYTLPVVSGRRLGRTLGAPTINQVFPDGLLLPRYGVYASVSYVGAEAMYSVTNIGMRPTVGADRPLSETWIPDYSGDLYGDEIRVELAGFLRPEQRFDCLEELRAQIHRDADMAKLMINEVLGKDS